MGESGSLVQPAGSAAFLSPEMGEQQSRNVPQRERRVISRVKEKRQEATRRKRKGRAGHFTMGVFKCYNRPVHQIKRKKRKLPTLECLETFWKDCVCRSFHICWLTAWLCSFVSTNTAANLVQCEVTMGEKLKTTRRLQNFYTSCSEKPWMESSCLPLTL